MSTQSLNVRVQAWPLHKPFVITGHVFETINVLLVEVERDGLIGSGEASGVYYRDDRPHEMASQLDAIRWRIEAGIDIASLQSLLPAGGARNALDCALWDLEAKVRNRPVWQLAGLEEPRPVRTTFTCGVDTPARMAEMACSYEQALSIKLKLNGDGADADRVRAVREARSDVWLGVDANQAFDRDTLQALMPTLVDCGVQLIEQPFPIGRDAWLDGSTSPIPLAADESVQTSADLEPMRGRYDVVNIKLDKSGGLTEALLMARQAKQLGFQVMVGNMIGTSLSIAPAWLLGQLCSIADLDGPIFLRDDRAEKAIYENGLINCPPAIWGSGRGKTDA